MSINLLLQFTFINYQKTNIMKMPSSPNQITWIIGLVCGLLGIIGHYYTEVQILTEYNYILLLIGFLVLAAGTTFKQI